MLGGYFPTLASCFAFFALFFFSRDGIIFHQLHGEASSLKDYPHVELQVFRKRPFVGQLKPAVAKF